MSGKRNWKLQEFVAHSANVNCLSLGRVSGRVMVTGGDDKKVNLWAVGKPNCIMSLTGHTTAVECVRFDPREVMVCAGSMAGALKIWDLEAVKIIRTLTGHKGSVKCLDFHPYGDFIASGSQDNNIKLWDIRRKGCIYTYKGHSKSVNTLKFSPDGKWVATGGEDGSVKLWDLSAGKLLTEFSDHIASVSDVEFHPNEFLLASGSADRTVKFWDLESLQLVSSTDVETVPVRCLSFHMSGTCLFGGCNDVLKVYGWEPSCTYDSVLCGWGKVSDMTLVQNQLVAGSSSMNSVSVHVVQISTLCPFRCPDDNGSDTYIPAQHMTKSSHVRRNFIKESSSKNVRDIDVKIIDESSNPDDDMENDNLDLVDDPETIFIPRSELCRTPPKSDPFPVPLDDPVEYPTKSSVIKEIVPNTLNSLPITVQKSEHASTVFRSTETQAKVIQSSRTYKLGSPVKSSITLSSSPLKTSSTIASSSSINNFHQTYVLPNPAVSMCQPNMMPPYSRVPDVQCHQSTVVPDYLVRQQQSCKPLDKPMPTLRRQMPYPPEAVSIVRPTIPEKESMPQRAVVLPEQLKSRTTVPDFVPHQRDKPVELDVDDFLPKTMRGSLHITDALQPEISEAEAMTAICRKNQQMLSVYSHRCHNLRVILSIAKSKDHKTAIQEAVHMNDQSILVDMLSHLNRRPALWSLDICQILLPSIQDLVQSKYESHMSVGCESLRLILKRFGSVIKSNVEAPPSIGVDLCGEERTSKCKYCYEQLLAIRSFILKRQTMQGELGQSFRELLKIMCSELSNM